MKLIRIEESDHRGFIELQENHLLLLWRRWGGRLYTTATEAMNHLQSMFDEVKPKVNSDGTVVYVCNGERDH